MRVAETAPLRRLTPATLIGKGVVERMKAAVEEQGIGLVVVDDQLTPVQQRNLEKALEAKVIDRTGLILEIFGARARTHEGRLQVELAALDYQRGRLVRSWTHLERQRGGFGFLGGPGEIADRDRPPPDRRAHRADQARPRGRAPHARRQSRRPQARRGCRRSRWSATPTPASRRCSIASSGAGVMAKDLLFATLDPTMRSIKLPNGKGCVISDTVGFVSDLPTHLVAAFRATLEEVIEADLIVHVRDISHPDSEQQRADVETVLRELGAIEEGEGAPIIEALNKIDALPEERAAHLQTRSATGAERARQYPVSALTGRGRRPAPRGDRRFPEPAPAKRAKSSVPLSDGATIAWLYRHGEVSSRHDDGETARLTVALDAAASAQFERRAGALTPGCPATYKRPIPVQKETP